MKKAQPVEEIVINRGVYAIRNKQSNKVYVGSSSAIEVRTSQHKKTLSQGKHWSIELQHDWDLLGESKFSFEILEKVPLNEDLLDAEQRWVSKTKCYERAVGYNTAKNVRQPMLGRRRNVDAPIRVQYEQKDLSLKIPKEKIARKLKMQGKSLLTISRKLNIPLHLAYQFSATPSGV